MKTQRKPDYRVAALNKTTDLKGNVGAAWNNDDETISIVLNNFTCLQQSGDLLITLFPNTMERALDTVKE